MARLEFEMETSLPPEKVISMLTDFSEDRPDVWPGLRASDYQVYTVGDNTAEIREGNPGTWARERYDWSKPGTVRWEVLESNFCKPGSFVEATATPTETGGSQVHVVWDRRPSSLMGFVVVSMVSLLRGGPVKTSIGSGFKKAERSP